MPSKTKPSHVDVTNTEYMPLINGEEKISICLPMKRGYFAPAKTALQDNIFKKAVPNKRFESGPGLPIGEQWEFEQLN